MADRLRKLVNTHGSTPWNVSKLGFTTAIAISGGELDVTTVFTDSDLSSFLQRGDLVLSATNKLVVETPSGVLDITSAQNFGAFTKETITDQTNSQHTHAGAAT